MSYTVKRENVTYTSFFSFLVFRDLKNSEINSTHVDKTHKLRNRLCVKEIIYLPPNIILYYLFF